MSPRARIIVIAGAAACLAAGGTVALAVITSNGKSGNQNKPVPLAGAPPLALDLGVRTDPEARSLRRAERLYSTKQRAAAGRIFVRYHSPAAQVGAAFAAWPGSGLATLERLAQEHPQDSLVLLHLGYANLLGRRLRAGNGGLAASGVRPAGHHVRPTCGRRPASCVPSRRAPVRPELRAAGPARRAVASAPVRAAQEGRAPGPMPTRSSCTGSRSSGSAAASPPSGSSTPPPGSTPAIRRRRSRPPSAASTRASRPQRSRASARSRSAIRTPPRSGSTSASCCSGWPVPNPARWPRASASSASCARSNPARRSPGKRSASSPV